MKYFIVLMLIVLVGCAPDTRVKAEEKTNADDVQRDQNGLIKPNPDGSIPVQKDRQDLNPNQGARPKEETSVQDMEWISSTREKNPEWYTCKTDQECVGVTARCGMSCRGDAMNSKGYSDYVVAFSKYCEG